tara:strand:- start:45 stop:473 length:429 start_codon:yes stop_codon:yes gene_type:complete
MKTTNEILFISNTDIKQLKRIPEGTKKVFCSGLGLTKLPKLPSTLTHLHCQDNDLEKIPKLPIGLEVLDCSNNKLKNIPNLPSSLKTLIINGNKMTDISFASYINNHDLDIGDYGSLIEFLNDNTAGGIVSSEATNLINENF